MANQHHQFGGERIRASPLNNEVVVRVFVIEAINDRIAPFISLGHSCGNLRLSIVNISNITFSPRLFKQLGGGARL